MVIHAPRMACRPDIGVESGCQLVPEPSRLMEYGPSSPIMASAPASGSEGCAAAAGASAARESPFGGTVAHGFLTLSLIAPTAFEVLLTRIAPKSVVNYGLEKVRFVAPVRSGKRVRNRIKIAAVEPKGGGRYLVTTENTMEIEGETKPALIASGLAMFMA